MVGSFTSSCVPRKIKATFHPNISGTLNGGTKHLYKLYGYGLCKGKATLKIALYKVQDSSILGTIRTCWWTFHRKIHHYGFISLKKSVIFPPPSLTYVLTPLSFHSDLNKNNEMSPNFCDGIKVYMQCPSWSYFCGIDWYLPKEMDIKKVCHL